MRDPIELQEIEKFGEEDLYAQPDPIESIGESGGFLPLLQTVLCVLLLLALAVCKFTDEKTYEQAANWFQTEIQKEIELPHLGEKGAAREGTAEQLLETAGAQAEDTFLQKV